jgi:hypothetical protein
MSESASAGPTKPRYGEYTQDDGPLLVVRITAADYNGDTFDGPAFSAKPSWLLEAITEGRIRIKWKGDTDYAMWEVLCADHLTKIAGPGDYIVRRERGELSVVEESDAFILINLRPPVEGDEERERQ